MFAGIAIDDAGVHSFDFVPSRGRLDGLNIPDAATAPPARLLLEVGRRLLRRHPRAGALIIGNPVVPTTAAALSGWVAAGARCPAVVTDGETGGGGGFPLGYVLPRRLFDEGLEKFLLLLSGVSAAADGQFLETLLGESVGRIASGLPAVQLPLSLSRHGAFHSPGFTRAWGAQCVNALRLMRRHRDWRDLPFAACHPYHAGDVLFFSLASRLCRTPLYDEQIVCAAYADIWRTGDSPLGLVETRLPPLMRGEGGSEGGHYLGVIEDLGPAVTDQRFIVYARYSRYYAWPPFHLIDQARFSLGDSMEDPADLYGAAGPPLRRCREPLAPPHAPLSVLVVANGGWPLKGYRDDQLSLLVRLLRACTIAVTVLDPGPPALRARLRAEGAAIADAPSVALLEPLIRRHHILISADSFPHHFAACVLGHPTIGLFGNTSPWNSRGPRLPHYRLLTNFLPCSPCGAEKDCQLTGGETCHNLPQPEQVVSAVLDMAEEIYR